jgi:hypothetical protein
VDLQAKSLQILPGCAGTEVSGVCRGRLFEEVWKFGQKPATIRVPLTSNSWGGVEVRVCRSNWGAVTEREFLFDPLLMGLALEQVTSPKQTAGFLVTAVWLR